ncbi:MAG: hypothetical protein ACFFDT_23065 [Candidatus Hodarchaeota archaeon]
MKFGTGEPVTIVDSCLRNCWGICPCLLLIISGRRCFGDYIGGTIVIKDQ